MITKSQKFRIFTLMIAISILIGFSYATIVDNDLLWHFKLGENILQYGVTSKDFFSWQE